MSISVVIPSIGEIELSNTVKAILNSRLKLNEIIIVLPKNSNTLLPKFIIDSCKVIYSNAAGQVNQRCYGFRNVDNSSNFVLQLDSDIFIDKNLIEKMCEKLKKLPFNSALGIRIIDADAGKESDWMFCVSGNSFFNKIFHFLINGSNGYQPGKFSKTGINYPFIGVDSISQVGWLPGGCILHRKENLVTENFYNFSGKAYCEDLFHSMELKKNNINLYYTNTLSCSTKIYNHKSFANDTLKAFYIHFKFAKKYFNTSFLRFFLIYKYYYLSKLLKILK